MNFTVDQAPQVSVIMPAKNAMPWLPSSVASIGAFPGAEILIVDDGSDDGTVEWIQEAAARDPRIRMLVGPRTGPSAARNTAIAEARAPLVAFLDADDIWAEGKLAAQMALHRDHPEIGFSFTDYDHVTVEGLSKGACFGYWPLFRQNVKGCTEPFVMGPVGAARIYAENVVGTSTVVARTDLLRQLGGQRTQWGSSEDWDLWLRLAQLAPVGCIPKILANYLMHRPGNVSGQSSRRAVAMREIAALYRDEIRQISPVAVKACTARILVAEADAAAAAGANGKALRLRLGALVNRPTLRHAREAAACAVAAARAIGRTSGRAA